MRTKIFSGVFLLLALFWGAYLLKESRAVSPIYNSPEFSYYGWFLVDYDKQTEDLKKIRAYTNTGFAVTTEQVSILHKMVFQHIIFMLNNDHVFQQVLSTNEADPLYQKRFFEAYRAYLLGLRQSFIDAGVLDVIDIFSLADEPELHRNIYPNQEFLEKLTGEFKKVFPEKKAAMAFAQNPDPRSPSFERGAHFAPPQALDIVIVDPYIDPEKVKCTEESVRNWLYAQNPASNIEWGKQYKKTLIVVGDAQLRNGKQIDSCYQKLTFEILKKDKEVSGLIWFAYDRSYHESDLSGAANDTVFVNSIESLSVKTR